MAAGVHLTALPRPHSWIKGSLGKGMGREWRKTGRGKGREGKGSEWRERGERRREVRVEGPLLLILDTPLLLYDHSDILLLLQG